ncbi:hypothetical protein [Dyadobacter sandarakinus]|uniref:Uncharacterized protein n=1 Tax=Dyadobacter sandarakinus TaxID=2747268 RepID=A0ABX7I3K1_9BACT|nr:hypothetical protein [Dyadobacter sandarakinus]QRR00646.1 hypothetical protein HWI92_06855 [Dyadobacter sandarakinus]
MKKYLVLLLINLVWVGNSIAQDLIVTTAGDSIFCKITREHDGFVYFNYIREGVPSNTLIAADAIASKQKGMYKARVKYAG